MIVFGPVPSRRLGRSLGINNIPPKLCSYACVYCQLGPTTKMRVWRRALHPALECLEEVRCAVGRARAAGERIDYLTFVADGEPTLDISLGHEIELLKTLELKVAVITNGSLIWQPDVREDLLKADWVSLKVDAVSEPIWRRVNRPHRALGLDRILDSMLTFAAQYRGELVTETMLVRGINDSAEEQEKIASFLSRLRPATAYLAVPTRPPAEIYAQAPDEATVNRSYVLLHSRLDHVELLNEYEGNAFASTDNIADDLLRITAVHPMREEAVRELLARAGAEWSVVQALLDSGHLVETTLNGRKFYMRKLTSIAPQGVC